MALNPTARSYSFFSNFHQTFSCIDFFLLDKKLLPVVKECTYKTIVISNHSPLICKLKLHDIPISHPRWRFNTTMLSDEDKVLIIATNIDVYIKTNCTPDVSHCTVWEAFKAYLRSLLISESSFAKKQRTQTLNHLTDKISQIDDQIASCPSPDLLKERLLLQADFDTFTSLDTEKMLFKFRHSHYEFGQKALRLLAHQIWYLCYWICTTSHLILAVYLKHYVRPLSHC